MYLALSNALTGDNENNSTNITNKTKLLRNPAGKET